MSDFNQYYLGSIHGFSLFLYPELKSTNTFAKENSSHFPSHSAIIAQKQTQGKGRFDRSWQSIANKDLTFTLILDNPVLLFDDAPAFTQIMAMCLIEVLEKLGIESFLKWPNDVWTEGGKIAGILCESSFQKSDFRMFCGMGINVGSTKKEHTAIDQKVDSIANYNQNYEPIEILELWLEQLLPKLADFKQNGLLKVHETLSQKLLFRGKTITLSALTKEMDTSQIGNLVGISPKGRLLVDISGVGIREFHSGEVRLAKTLENETT